jgi:hypothetical protein
MAKTTATTSALVAPIKTASVRNGRNDVSTSGDRRARRSIAVATIGGNKAMNVAIESRLIELSGVPAISAMTQPGTSASPT